MRFVVVTLVLVAFSALSNTLWLVALTVIFYVGYRFVQSIDSLPLESPVSVASPSPPPLPRPWEVQASQSVSDSLAELLEEILTRYVLPWYSVLSPDIHFLAECRASLRAGVAQLYARLSRVSPWSGFSTSTLPRLVSQLSFLSARLDHQSPDAILLALPPDVIHPVVKSIQAEDAYWRSLCAKVAQRLFPHLSSTAGQLLNVVLSSNVLIPALDLACSEAVVLKALLSLHSVMVKQVAAAMFTPKSESLWPIMNHRSGSILLYEFGQRRRDHDHKSLFAISNRSLIDDQDILYNFKKWLQAQQSVPLLNYVHAFEDFNRRFFAKAELTTAEVDAFHRELSQIIDGYFTAESTSRIPVKHKIQQELKAILFERDQRSREFSTELALRASRPLTIAYNTALSLLEEYYIPDFCHDVYSDDAALTCGNAAGDVVGPRDSYQKLLTKRSTTMSRSASFTMFNTGTQKTRSVKTRTPSVPLNDEYFAEDLSRVRTTIPRIVKDPKSGDHVFVICVEKAQEDDDFERHEQFRYYAEFYALESKLKEFHGQLRCSLPTRRLVLRNEDYYIKVRTAFESWLQKLVTRPEFRHSKLIFDFIKNDESASFSSNLLESSISLNRFSQPINKIIQNKRSPRLIGHFSSLAAMHYARADTEWRLESNEPAQLDQRAKQLDQAYLERTRTLCVVEAQSQKVTNEHLFNSISTFIINDVTKSPWLRQVLAGCQRFITTLVKHFYTDKSTNNTNQLESLTGPTVESLSIVLLSLLNGNGESEEDVVKLRQRAQRVYSRYPFGRTLLKIAKSKLLIKQLYYTLLNDSILMLFPEFGKFQKQ